MPGCAPPSLRARSCCFAKSRSWRRGRSERWFGASALEARLNRMTAKVPSQGRWRAEATRLRGGRCSQFASVRGENAVTAPAQSRSESVGSEVGPPVPRPAARRAGQTGCGFASTLSIGGEGPPAGASTLVRRADRGTTGIQAVSHFAIRGSAAGCKTKGGSATDVDC